jgi:hypothetical protein
VKYIKKGQIVELTVRNITALLAKLDDRVSARTLISPAGDVIVRAVEGDAARGGEAVTRAVTSEGVVMLTRDELWRLATPGATVMVAGFTVRSVADEAHYGDRAPGQVYMPEMRRPARLGIRRSATASRNEKG